MAKIKVRAYTGETGKDRVLIFKYSSNIIPRLGDTIVMEEKEQERQFYVNEIVHYIGDNRDYDIFIVCRRDRPPPPYYH